MAENKEQIIKKIQALLAKNTDNGATEYEAISAIKMANTLMQKYFISENDIKDPFVAEKCKMVETKLIKSSYDFGIFYADLANLFDCEHFYNSQRIAFYGFERDAELCGYFYSLIVRSALREKDKYMQSKEAIRLKNYYHGRTIAASFIKGFLIRVAEKMREMYKEKQTNIPQSYGLVLVKKKQKVDEQFSSLGLKIKEVKGSDINIGTSKAFIAGEKVGDDFYITQGISNYQKDNRQQIALK